MTLTLLGLVTIVAFEAMSITTVMPAVADALEVGSGYGLAFSLLFTAQLVGIVAAGPWAAARGPMPPVWVGLVLFAGGSGLAGLAHSYAVLLAGRVVTGLGAGLVIVALYVAIGAVYPLALRPKVFGWTSSAWVLPSIIGPWVGAQLTVLISWRAAFLLVVPCALATALGLSRASRLLREAPPPEYRDDVEGADPLRDRRTRTTLGLGVAVALGAGVFQLGTSSPGLALPLVALCVVLGLAALGYSAPRLVPAGTVRARRGQPSVMLARFLIMASFGGTTTFAPLMLVRQQGLSLGTAGALLALASLGWSTGSFVQGRRALIGRGPELVAVGALVATLGTALLTLNAATAAPSALNALGLVVIGLGMGLGVTATSVLALELAPAGGHAAASSALQLSDVLGSVLGISLASALYAFALSGGWAGASTYPLVFAVMTLIAAGTVLVGRRIRPQG